MNGKPKVTERLVYAIDRDDEKERLAFMVLDDGTYRFLLEYQEADAQHGYLWASNDFAGRYESLDAAEAAAPKVVPWFKARPSWGPQP